MKEEDGQTKHGLRLACLVTLLAEKNHSAIEILTEINSWGLPCINAPDYYLHLLPKDDPLNRELIASLKAKSEDEGLPHELLIS